MNVSFIDLTGFVGAILLVAAFYMITSGRWSSRTQWYQVLNTVAGGLLAYYTWEKGAYFAAAINIIWMTVAIAGLMQIAKKTTR